MTLTFLQCRGQPPARHTKVVDNGLCPLKTGPTRLCVPVCVNDTILSKPAGRNAVDGQAQTNNVSCVCICGSIRCKIVNICLKVVLL